MRKPSKAFLYVLTIGIVAVLVSIGLYTYYESKARQERLLSEIAVAQQTIDQLRDTDMSALEAEIAELESTKRSTQTQIATSERILRQFSHSIEIEEALFDAALETNVEIVKITARPAEPVEQQGIVAEVYPMVVVAESAVPPSLVNFSMAVTDTLESAVVDGVSIEYPEPAEDDEGDEADSEEAEPVSTIELRLSLYYLDDE